VTFDPVITIEGRAVPLLRPNIDTDLIIRVDRMVSTDPAALAPFAFEAIRYLDDGNEDPACSLNQPEYRRAPILLAGRNFGCGSSREPAVWAIAGLGVRCVIAPSFGDIFAANCFQNGIIAITLPGGTVEAIAEAAAASGHVVVDLAAQTLASNAHNWTFEIAALHKTALTEGFDDLDLTVRYLDAADAWITRDRARRPWAWTVAPTAGDTP
jgi:3-isopropylmalate/(R)-2-methylmalate dehydratase small subunit